MAPFVPLPPPRKSSLFSCFGGGDADEPDFEPTSPDSSGPGHLSLLSNIDSLNVSEPWLGALVRRMNGSAGAFIPGG